ncbi:hypothetical protein OAM41_06485 [Gammaproteobacteria bacterium]|nr:hypothetical protein [Gammaproteobacteria bacterium]
MFKELLNHINTAFAITSWCLSWILTPMLSNILCNPMLPSEEDYLDYISETSSYCYFYDEIFYSFFSFGDNSFIDLLLFTMLGYLVALIIEIILTIIDYIRFKLIKNPYIQELEINEREEYNLLNELSLQVRLGGFILLFLSNWFVGGI